MSNFKNEALTAHNEYRARHGSTPFKWSSKLESNAARWARQLAQRNVMQHENQKTEGENIAMMYGKELSAQGATDMWYDEIKLYNFKRPGFNEKTGHFTQLIWAGSKEIGMAIATSSGGTQFVVARYSPPGNVISKFPENVKPSGSTVSAPKNEKSMKKSLKKTKPEAKKGGRVNAAVNQMDNRTEANQPGRSVGVGQQVRIDVNMNSGGQNISTSNQRQPTTTNTAVVSSQDEVLESVRAFRRAVLRTHNMYRQRHHTAPLRNSSRLSKAAQTAADGAAASGSTAIKPELEMVGQNIATLSGGVLRGARVSEMWYEGESKYNYNNGQFSTETGSFTQLVWAASTEMGVGRAVGRNGKTVVVVYYSSAGNVRGNAQFEENVARPSGPVPVDSGGGSQGCCVIC